MGIFTKKEEREIIKKAEEKAKIEKAEQEKLQKIAEEKRKLKTYNRLKSEYEGRVWNFASNENGFGRFCKYIAKQTDCMQKRIPFNPKQEIKYFKLEKLANYLDELLPKGELPPVKE